MHDNEVKALLISSVRNGLVVVCAGGTVVGLYALSHSWHALWGLLILVAITSVKTGKAAEIEAQAELEAARRGDD